MQKSSGTLYWTDDSAHALSLSDLSGNITRDYIYFNGQMVATMAGGNPYYLLADRINSTGVVASGDGKAVMWDADYYPFGGRRVVTNSFDNHYLFTGYEFDYETGYHYAVNRYESPNNGRFYSVDPGHGDVTNPQSWNRYTYVLDNPSNLVDPTGMFLVVYSGDGDGGGPGATDPFYGGDNSGCRLIIDGVCQDDPFGNGPEGDKGGSGGGGRNPKTKPPYRIQEEKQLQNLTSCVNKLYNVDLKTFVPIAPGSNGYFYGVRNGQGITVETNVTHSSLYLGVIIFPPSEPVAGRTPLSTASSQMNYVASDQLYMVPGLIQPTQIHELAHSLDQITSGSIFGSSEPSADRLLDCVNNP